MKRALRNKTAEKRLKMATFKLFSLICTLPYIFFPFIRTVLLSSMFLENTRNMGLAHIKIMIFSDFSTMGVGLENDS